MAYLKVNKFFPLPRIINLIIIASMVYTIFNVDQWKNKENGVIHWDVISYYAYVPATFIYKDLSFQFVDTVRSPEVQIWYHNTETGGRAIRTSMGLGYMYTPFFLVAHAITPLTTYTPNGYTAPYKLSLLLACICYVAIGLYYMRKILSKYFSAPIVILVTLAIVFGTNLFYYSTLNAAMSHGFSFCLITAFVYFTIKFYNAPNLKRIIILGLLFGLLTLIRPTNIVILTFFLLYDIRSISSLFSRLKFLVLEKKYVLPVMLVTFLFVWFPQMLFWKQASGQWLYYSYTSENSFFFNNPQFTNTLFSFRKGLLIYAPVLIFGFAGIPVLFKRLKAFSWGITLFVVINLYIISSWFDWWYGGGFGQRALIDSLIMMSIPMGVFLQWIFSKKTIYKILFFIFFVPTLLLGAFHSIQYYYGAIHWDSMTKEAYFDSFFRNKPSPKFNSLIRHPDYNLARQGIYKSLLPEAINVDASYNTDGLQVNNNYFCGAEQVYEDNGILFFKQGFHHGETQSNEKVLSGNYAVKLDETNFYGPTLDLFGIHAGDVITGSVWRYGNDDGIMVFCTLTNNKFYTVIESEEQTNDEGWDELKYSFQVPQELDQDTLRIYIASRDQKKVYFDDMRITIYSGE